MGYRTNPADMPGGDGRDSEDHARLRHAREREIGFAVGKYLQPSPMLFTRDGHNIFLGDTFRGKTGFLLCSGPSLNTHDLSLLNQRGILTCATNNAAAVFRPHLWVSVDDPSHFVDAIWRDPGIWKFVPLCHMEKHFSVRDGAGHLVASNECVGDVPCVFGYRRNENFVAEQWLYEDTFNWGNHGDRTDTFGIKGSRSVMLVALRLLFYLGVRKLFLLGCDFRMRYGAQNYAFEQNRSRGSVSGNNSTFEALNVRLNSLLPYFFREGYQVFNCTPDSGLKVFPHISFPDAVAQALQDFPSVINTAGMYDQKSKAGSKDFPSTSVSPAVHAREALRTKEKQLPATTLVTYVDQQAKAYLPQTWATWCRFRPWLRTQPAIVLHAAGDDMTVIKDELSAIHPNVRFTPLFLDVPCQDASDWSYEGLRLAAKAVETSWFLLLAPEAIAVRDEQWLNPTWLSQKEREAPLAFLTCPWSYAKPANVFERLDCWGNSVAELANFPPLNIPFDPKSDRISQPSANTWFLMGSTEWSRAVMRYVPDGLPCASFSTFVVYCARRRGDRFLLHQMKRHGWDHSFRGHDRIANRCKQLLSS